MSRLASLFIGKTKESPHEAHDDDPALQPYHILFVDDEFHVLNAMRRIFRKENYVLHTAESGEAAINILGRETIHVVISDYKMPHMTGAELLRKVKAEYPETIRIMLTGHADVNAVMGAINDGAVYKFITKPWNDDDLRITISLALEQYDLIKENTHLKKKQDVQKKEIGKLSKFASRHMSQLGRILLKKNLISREDYDKASAAQTKSGKLFPVILIEAGITDESTIIKAIQSELNINRVYPNEFGVPSALAELIPADICRQNLLVPLKHDGGKLIIAMADPTDYIKVDDLKFITGIVVKPVIAEHREILAKIDELFGQDATLEAALSEIDTSDPLETIEIILDDEDEEDDIEEILRSKDQPPAIRIVNAIMSDAMRHAASDIHIEPKTKYLMVRYRMDGLLNDKLHIPLSMHPAIVSRIKVMAELDISERRKPQDGRVTIKTSSKMVDMRISTLPTINGEKVVLRLLDRNASIKQIEDLGFSENALSKVTGFIDQPQGIILTTGPTGSGKTSTLYSLLHKSATIHKNYTTIEDPVEYFMNQAEQVMIREKIGLSFPVVLRSLLRQDPDVIMLGEIRDFETAEVAFHAALTGHLVLSTLHTNSSIASITRLRDIGIKPYVISDALTGIIAQRLLRRNCPDCIEPYDPGNRVLDSLGMNSGNTNFRPRHGKGCEKCNQNGYQGRIGVFEVFQVDMALKELLHRDASASQLLNEVKLSGMTTLFEDALDKTGKGLTTLEEILRVLGPRINTVVRCSGCRHLLEERYHYCPFCGKPPILKCQNCKRPMGDEWLFCPDCGHANNSQSPR